MAVFGNLVVMGIAVALFVATVNLGKRRANDAPEPRSPRPRPVTQPPS